MTELHDELEAAPVVESRIAYPGVIWDIRSETFTLPEAPRPMHREFTAHTSAVAIAAVDSQDRILLIRQYRHPVLAREWEIPAGLLDQAGESGQPAAARELYEEADLRAAEWSVLADQYTTPGSSSEVLRIFLARGLSAVPRAQQHAREDEELGIEKRWVDLSEAAAAVSAGGILNATCQLAVLHAERARAAGWAGLRPGDAPWPSLEHIRAAGHARLPRG
jgi:8-oxo-dGTP pyrophosphatase MutT (NUDIX family)